MAFNGSGTFVLTYNWAVEAATPPIALSKLDTEFENVKGGLELCLTRDGQNSPSAAMDWNDKDLTNVADIEATSLLLDQAGGGSASALRIRSGTPGLQLYETDAATDAKMWDIVAVGGDLFLRAVDDASVGASNVLAVSRTGTTVNYVLVGGPLLLRSASSDPTVLNGSVYYNSTTHKFRGCANGTWVDLN